MYFKDGSIGERREPFAAAFQACQQLPQFGQMAKLWAERLILARRAGPTLVSLTLVNAPLI